MSLKFLLVGDGNIGQVHKRIISSGSDTKIVGVVDFKYKKNIKKGVSFYNNIDEVNLNQNNYDGVVIATYTDSHIKLAKKILSKGIPVFIEKPLTTRYFEIDQLIKIAKKNKTFFRVGLIETYNPIFKFLNNNLDLNKLDLIHIYRHSPMPQSDRKLDNVIFDLLIHDIAVLYQMFNTKKINLVSKTFVKSKGVIETVELMLKIGKTNIFISASRQSQIKERKWTFQSSDYLYHANLLNKSINEYTTGEINYLDKNNPLFETKKSEITFINEKETAQIQFEKFLDNIYENKFDQDHLKTVIKSHKFVSLLK